MPPVTVRILSAPGQVTTILPGRKRMALPFQLVAVGTWAGDIAALGAATLLFHQLGAIDHVSRVLPIAAICYSCLARAGGGYDFDSLLSLRLAAPRLIHGWLTTVLAIAGLSYSLGVLAWLPWQEFVVLAVAGSVAMTLGRAVVVQAARTMKRAGIFDGRTAVIGSRADAAHLIDHVSRGSALVASLIFFSDDREAIGDDHLLAPGCAGDTAALVDAIRAGVIDKVLVAIPWADDARLRAIVSALSATPVEIRLAPDRNGLVHARRRVSSLAGLSVVTLLDQPLSRPQRYLKAAEDRVIALTALIVLSPLMLLVAALVKLSSPGPVLFRQPREGFNCRSFDILKFRTMTTEASGRHDVVQVCRGDPRVTRIGGWLRRYSLDELPQLLNVLAGQMSLVGPRPHAPSTRAGGRLFSEVAGSYAARHKVKPGLTGWAQVCGWRGETSTEERLIRRLEHDMYYVEHWSLWFDFYILARTVSTVLSQRNAY